VMIPGSGMAIADLVGAILARPCLAKGEMCVLEGLRRFPIRGSQF
jgi:hypothetical protein